MDHPHLFFAAFGDELNKLATVTPAPVASTAQKLLKRHGRDLAVAGTGALGLLATQKAIQGARQAGEDWKQGREIRQAHAGRY